MYRATLVLAWLIGAAVCEGEPGAQQPQAETLDASPRRADVSSLIEQLSDPEANVRASAARQLGVLGSKALPAVPALIRALEDASLSELGEPIPVLASRALGKMGPEAVPRLVECLTSSNPRVVAGAAAALGEIGPAAGEAIEPLMRALEKDDPKTRIALMSGLKGIGPEAQPAVDLLIRFLDHENFHARYWACQALGGIGPRAAAAVPTLCRRTRDTTGSVRRHAAAALGNIGPAIGEQGLNALIQGLPRDPLDPVRHDAVTALAKLGPLAKPSVPAIQTVLHDQKIGSPAPYARTLWLLTHDPDLVVPALVEEFRGPFGGSPESAELLGELGEAAVAAVPVLAASLQSSDLLLRLEAARALGRMGPAAEAALPDLRTALQDPSPDVRRAARQAIREINPESEKPSARP